MTDQYRNGYGGKRQREHRARWWEYLSSFYSWVERQIFHTLQEIRMVAKAEGDGESTRERNQQDIKVVQAAL